MNEGTLSYIFVCIACIMLCTGWRQQIIGELPARAAWLWLIGWLLLVGHPGQLQLGVPISFSAAIALFVAIAVWARSQAQGMALYGMACACICAMLWVWSKKMYAFDPVMYAWHPVWDAPIITGVFAGLANRAIGQHWLVLAAGLGGGEAALVASSPAAGVAVGTYGWWDSFYAALAIAITVSSLQLAVAFVYRRLQARLLSWWGRGSYREGTGQ